MALEKSLGGTCKATVDSGALPRFSSQLRELHAQDYCRTSIYRTPTHDPEDGTND